MERHGAMAGLAGDAGLTVAAIVVARGGSKRLPRKAMLPIGGEPMIARKVRQLRQCQAVHRVYVNSDDDEMRDAAVEAGAVPIVGADYAGDTRRMIADSVRQVDADVVLWAHPTNPLVGPDTYARAIEAFFNRDKHFDSLVSVTPIRRHAWIGGEPFNYNPWGDRHTLAAELPPIHFQDGAIFIQPRKQMAENRYFFGNAPMLFEVPWNVGWDIDTPLDYQTALALEESWALSATC